MNLSDLRDELDLRAHDLEADASTISAGVAGKVRATKRRRTAAGAVAACAIAAIAGLTAWNGMKPPTTPAPAVTKHVTLGADGLPSRVIPDAPGDVIKDGLRYRAHVADDRLAAGFIGDRGQGQFTLLWEPTTIHVSISAECYLPGLTADEAQTYMVTVGLEGHEGVMGSWCSAQRPEIPDLPAGGAIPGEPGQGWTDLTVGQTARLRVQLVDAKTKEPRAVDGALLTGAVYELGPQAKIADEAGKTVAVLPDRIEHQGYTYRLVGTVAGPLAKGYLPEVTTPRGIPFLLTWGSAGVVLPSAGAGSDMGHLQLSGLDEASGRGIEGGGWSTVAQRARGGGSAAIRVEGPQPKHGIAFIATYVPVG